MQLEDFIDKICREKPSTLERHEVASVHPQPWVTRRGSGKQTRIRMAIGKQVWYERQPGGETWHRVDDGSEFDIINPLAA
jgi:hypothetical protein